LKAAYYYGINDLRVMDIPVPKIKEDEVLLKVKACAICASEIRTLKYGSKHVKPPRVLGHEVTGEVIEVGEKVKNIPVGDTVVVYPNVPCGRCYYCTLGKYNLCENLSGLAYDLDGGFAEYLRIPSEILKLNGLITIPSEQATEATLAEPLSTVINSVEKTITSLANKLSFSVAVIGTGPMGLMHIMLFRKFFGVSKIIAIDVDEKRLDYATKFGADETINASKEKTIEEVMKLTNGRGVDATIVATGVGKVIEEAVNITKPLGIINIFAGCPSGTAITIDPNYIHYGERIITGSYGSNIVQFKVAVELIVNRKIPVKEIITHKFKLDEITKAFDVAARHEGLKIVVVP